MWQYFRYSLSINFYILQVYGILKLSLVNRMLQEKRQTICAIKLNTYSTTIPLLIYHKDKSLERFNQLMTFLS